MLGNCPKKPWLEGVVPFFLVLEQVCHNAILVFFFKCVSSFFILGDIVHGKMRFQE